MHKNIVYSIIAIIAFLFGFVIAHDLYFVAYDDHDHSHNLPHPHAHMHEQLEIQENVPSLALEVTEDVKGGWNVHVLLDNFVFAAENVSSLYEEGKGHAHFYIDGDKITRLYGEWYYVPKEWLNAGEHEFKVTLSSNDHKELTFNGEVILARATVVV